MKNHTHRLMKLISVLCMLLYLSGCSHTQANTDQSLKLSKPDMKYKNIYIDNFTVSPKGVEENDPGSFLADSRSTCATELINSALFENVRFGSKEEAPNSGLMVQGELTKLRIVGGAARFWLGGMAGRSNMTIRLKLVDVATGSVVTEKDINEDTNPIAGAWSIGASDRGLPSTVGRLVAQYVVESAKK